MDPLYANLDKRNNSADQPQTPPAPQPSANSMPNFGQVSVPSAAPTKPIMSSSQPARLIVSSPESTEPIISSQSIISDSTRPIVSKPISSASGDIVLDIDQPKKKKKGLIVGLAIGLVGVFVLLFILLSQKTISNPSESNVVSMFNKYANYLLFQKDDDSSAINDQFDKSTSYTVDSLAFGSEDMAEKEKFLNTASSLYEEFLVEYDKISTKSAKLENEISYYSELLNFIKIYALLPDVLDNEIILGEYSNKNIEALLKAYDGFDVTNSTIEQYIDNYKKYLNLNFEYFSTLEEKGCVYDDDMDNNCAIQGIDYEKATEINAIKVFADSSIRTLKDDLKRECWVIQTILENDNE